MYIIRRVFKVKEGRTRKAAQVIDELGKAYEKAGRSPTRTYWSGYTVPGPELVYMDWTAETLSSPFDPDHAGHEPSKEPDYVLDAYRRVSELEVDSYIEFYEMP